MFEPFYSLATIHKSYYFINKTVSEMFLDLKYFG